MKTDPARNEQDARRAEAEANYEDALMVANGAPIGTPRFLHAMAEVRAAREALREINAARPS